MTVLEHGADTSRFEAVSWLGGDAVSRADDLRHRLIAKGRHLARLDLLQEAATTLEGAIALGGQDRRVVRDLNRVHRRLVPRWHFAMLNDAVRNAAFSRALAALDLRDTLVLDIGSGTGLLAMMAARQGARQTISCEMVESVAYAAMQIVAENGFGQAVTVVPKPSTDLTLGVDLPYPADVLITETVDCGLLGEGILPTLRHARQALLAPGAAIIPARATVRFRLLQSATVHRLNYAFAADGFDVSLFNRFSSQDYFPVRLNTWEHSFLSAPQTAFDFDFTCGSLEPRRRRIPVTVTQGGTVHGIVFWFDLELVPGITLSNAPDRSDSHWMQAVQCLEVPCATRAGEQLTVIAEHDDDTVTFAFGMSGASHPAS